MPSMSNTPAATMTYSGLVFTLDVEELKRALADSQENPEEGEWVTYTHDAGDGFLMELWSVDGGASWRAELSNETLEVDVAAHGVTMTGALDALMDKLKPFGSALERLKADVTNWEQ